MKALTNLNLAIRFPFFISGIKGPKCLPNWPSGDSSWAWEPEGSLRNLRYHTAETERFRQDAARRDPNASRWERFGQLGQRKALRTLIGTAGSWLLFDMCFYGSAAVNEVMGSGSTLHEDALHATYLALLALPGYNLAMLGFLLLAVLFLLLGRLYQQWAELPGLTLGLRGLTYLLSNWGPHTTTYVIPGEVPHFPTAVRSTAHGVSAAFGKAGALLGARLLKSLLSEHGVGVVMAACGAVSCGGLLWTALIVPYYTCMSMELADREENARAVHTQTHKLGSNSNNPMKATDSITPQNEQLRSPSLAVSDASVAATPIEPTCSCTTVKFMQTLSLSCHLFLVVPHFLILSFNRITVMDRLTPCEEITRTDMIGHHESLEYTHAPLSVPLGSNTSESDSGHCRELQVTVTQSHLKSP
eukprot:g37332.t1